MASQRKSKPTPPDDYVPEPYIVMEADRVLGRIVAALPWVHGVVDHGIDPASRFARAIVYVSASASIPAVTGLVITLCAYAGPAYGILHGREVLECEDLGDAIRQVAARVEAASQQSLAF